MQGGKVRSSIKQHLGSSWSLAQLVTHMAPRRNRGTTGSAKTASNSEQAFIAARGISVPIQESRFALLRFWCRLRVSILLEHCYQEQESLSVCRIGCSARSQKAAL